MKRFTGKNYMEDSILVFEMLKNSVKHKNLSTVEQLIQYVQDSTEGFWQEVWLKFKEDLNLERNEYQQYWHYTSELLPNGLQKVANEDIGAKRNKKNLNYETFFNKYCL